MRTWLHTVPRVWIIAATVGFTAVVTVGVVLAVSLLTGGETCEDWSAELVEAIEDGTLLDGSFEASEACKEQMRRDLDTLTR